MAADLDAPTAHPVSVSIGVAHLPTHARDLRALYAAADAALYEAKKQGRDRASTLQAAPAR
jgi:diguanylate cyclase (GGDEF)-like protein